MFGAGEISAGAVAAEAPPASDNVNPAAPNTGNDGTTLPLRFRFKGCLVRDIETYLLNKLSQVEAHLYAWINGPGKGEVGLDFDPRFVRGPSLNVYGFFGTCFCCNACTGLCAD